MGKQGALGISWCHYTLNPWEGCEKISPACDFCYAWERDKRWHNGENWGQEAFRLFHRETYWEQPYKWNAEAHANRERRRVFCGSLCDVMEDRRDLDEPRVKLYNLIDACEWLDFLLVTKRPENFRRLLPAAWLAAPRPNVWLITTVESPAYMTRVGDMVEIPAAVHGISAEPLFGDISGDLEPYLRHGKVNWVIAGGESGPNARPSMPADFRKLRDVCAAYQVAFHFKQWGNWKPCEQMLGGSPGRFATVKGESIEFVDEYPKLKWFDVRDAIVLTRVADKHQAGRLLDGTLHDGVPRTGWRKRLSCARSSSMRSPKGSSTPGAGSASRPAPPGSMRTRRPSSRRWRTPGRQWSRLSLRTTPPDLYSA